MKRKALKPTTASPLVPKPMEAGCPRELISTEKRRVELSKEGSAESLGWREGEKVSSIQAMKSYVKKEAIWENTIL